MKIGFIGTGSIASAIIQGLCNSPKPPNKIFLSPRNSTRAENLKHNYLQVEIGRNNQDVVDNSDWIFLTVRPDIAPSVLGNLQFKEKQRLINCVSTLKNEDIIKIIKTRPVLFKAIPLPAVAYQLGPIAYTPPNEEVQKLFNRIGSAVGVSDENELRLLAAVSAQIAPFYALQSSIQHWLSENGVDSKTAANYISSLYHSLSTQTQHPQSPSFEELISEVATQGGLNEQALSNLRRLDWFENVNLTLDTVLERLKIT